MIRFIAVGLILLALSACHPQAQDVKETRFLLGTIVEFTVYTEKEGQALKAITEAAAAMQHIEDIFTTFGDIDNSVKHFNRAKIGQVIFLDDAVEKLLLQSIHIHGQTMGAFDPTLGALNQLWGFSGDKLRKEPPSAQEIQKALRQSGVQNIQQRANGWIKTVEGLRLDFGAIAKGYAIDEAVEILKKHGFSQAIINAGGDIAVLGSHGEQPWRIAIRHPRQKEPLGWVEISSDANIVTSGDYERFYMYQGKRYHHILNPKSGMPAEASESVTVIASSATKADALSTAYFVLGAEQGKLCIEKEPFVQGLWVTSTGHIYLSNEMKKHFHVSVKPHMVH